tara:strand:- start:957 stop:1601 length:645 start_codon:yes stop_codon:yes gene_type:complete
MTYPANLDSLKSTIGRRTGLAKQNRFAVYMNLPLMSIDAGNIITNLVSGNFNPFQIINDPRDISLLCETAVLPGKSIATTEYQTNMKARKMPYGYISDDVSFTFLLTGDYYMKTVFDKWLGQIINQDRKTLMYKDDYVSEVEIQQLNDQNIPVYSCKLRKAFPINISQVDLGNTNENTVSRVTVTFAYDDWVEVSSTGSAIAAKIGNEIFNRFF